MMIFIDPISDFINGHPEMKMLALTFIVAIGALLVMDAAGFHTGIELLHMPLEKLIVYFAMVFCIVLELIQMRYNANVLAWRKERWKNETGCADRKRAHRGCSRSCAATLAEQGQGLEAGRWASRAHHTGHHRQQRVRHDAYGRGGRRLVQNSSCSNLLKLRVHSPIRLRSKPRPWRMRGSEPSYEVPEKK